MLELQSLVGILPHKHPTPANSTHSEVTLSGTIYKLLPTADIIDPMSSPPSSLPQGLPPELLHRIVADIAGDNETLKALSLTSRLFLPAVRQRLFAHLILQNKAPLGNRKTPGQKLLELLQSSPSIAGYITVLTFSDAVPNTAWLANDVALVALVDKLQLDLLKTLVFNTKAMGEPVPEVKRSLGTLCMGATNVEQLVLSYGPLDLLVQCRSQALKTVSLVSPITNEEYERPELLPPPQVNRSLQLLTLFHESRLKAVVDCILDERNGLELGGVQVVHAVAARQQDYGHILRALRKCTALEAFTFGLWHDGELGGCPLRPQFYRVLISG